MDIIKLNVYFLSFIKICIENNSTEIYGENIEKKEEEFILGNDSF